MKYLVFKITTVIMVFFFLSCSGQTEQKSNSSEESTNSSKEKDASCEAIKDMYDSLPKLKSYGKYTIYGSAECSPLRSVHYQFEYYDPNDTNKEKRQTLDFSLFDISLDDWKPMFDQYLITYEALKTQNLPTYQQRESKLNFGTKAMVVASANEDFALGATFDCLIKDKYYFHVLIGGDSAIRTTDNVEAFITKYISEIKVSNLK